MIEVAGLIILMLISIPLIYRARKLGITLFITASILGLILYVYGLQPIDVFIIVIILGISIYGLFMSFSILLNIGATTFKIPSIHNMYRRICEYVRDYVLLITIGIIIESIAKILTMGIFIEFFIISVIFVIITVFLRKFSYRIPIHYMLSVLSFFLVFFYLILGNYLDSRVHELNDFMQMIEAVIRGVG